MPNTTPDNIYWWDGLTPLSLETLSQNTANTIQDALNKRQQRSYRWDDSIARGNQTGMQAGDRGYQIDNKTNWQYTGSAWERIIKVTSGTTAPANPVDGDVWVVKAV
jgi:hypothetical protein